MRFAGMPPGSPTLRGACLQPQSCEHPCPACLRIHLWVACYQPTRQDAFQRRCNVSVRHPQLRSRRANKRLRQALHPRIRCTNLSAMQREEIRSRRVERERLRGSIQIHGIDRGSLRTSAETLITHMDQHAPIHPQPHACIRRLEPIPSGAWHRRGCAFVLRVQRRLTNAIVDTHRIHLANDRM